MNFLNLQTCSSILAVFLLLAGDSSAATIIIDMEVIQAHPELQSFAAELQSTLSQWYPYIYGLLRTENYSPPEVIRVYFSDQVESRTVAYTSDEGVIVANLQYFLRNPGDLGSMIHELVHILLQYPNEDDFRCPHWLSEGVADYIRYYKFQVHQSKDSVGENNAFMPQKPTKKQNITEGYEVSAYFLNYVVEKVREGILYDINEACRQKIYQENFWFQYTGKSLRRLWKNMMKFG